MNQTRWSSVAHTAAGGVQTVHRTFATIAAISQFPHAAKIATAIGFTAVGFIGLIIIDEHHLSQTARFSPQEAAVLLVLAALPRHLEALLSAVPPWR